MSHITLTAPNRLTPCTITLPPSKSIANRMLILGALCGVSSDVVLGRPKHELCDDIRGLANLTDQVMAHSMDCDTASPQKSHRDPWNVNVGAAGTAMRFGTALLAVSQGDYIITGTERLQQRPIGILVDALRQMGAHIDYMRQEGYPPLYIKGNPRAHGGSLTLKGNVSSQFISALLMIAPTLEGGLCLQLEGDIVSRTYIDLTMGLMRQFGVDVEWRGERNIEVKSHKLQAPDAFLIEADWSAASYWYEIEALSQTHVVNFACQLNADSMQGDKVVSTIFNEINSSIHNPSNSLNFDFTLCPDLAQTIVVTMCMLSKPFRFTGLQTLRIKETDRIEALRIELSKLGYELKVTDSTIEWDGTRHSPQSNPIIETYHDHRMAMAFAPCALTMGHIRIANPDVVSKSYPTYWSDLQRVGFRITEEND